MLKAGIVGLPNVGKSTLFNAVTRTRKAEAANYPFCTIDPNVGIVTVPDARLAVLQEHRQDHRHHPGGDRIRGHRRPREGRERRAKVSATNFSPTSARWTPSCRSCAASRTRTSITSPAAIDPVRDIEIITTELVLADLEAVQKAPRQTSPRTPSAATRQRVAEEAVLAKFEPHLDAGKPALTRRTHAGRTRPSRDRSSC